MKVGSGIANPLESVTQLYRIPSSIASYQLSSAAVMNVGMWGCCRVIRSEATHKKAEGNALVLGVKKGL